MKFEDKLEVVFFRSIFKGTSFIKLKPNFETLTKTYFSLDSFLKWFHYILKFYFLTKSYFSLVFNDISLQTWIKRTICTKAVILYVQKNFLVGFKFQNLKSVFLARMNINKFLFFWASDEKSFSSTWKVICYGMWCLSCPSYSFSLRRNYTKASQGSRCAATFFLCWNRKLYR